MSKLNAIQSNKHYNLFCQRNKTTPSFGENNLERTPKDDVFFFINHELLDDPQETILKKIRESINKESNFLGRGRDALVYKIKDEQYCVRIPLTQILKTREIGKKINFNITNKDKVNHIIAKIDDNITLMKLIEGKNLFKNYTTEVLELPKETYKRLIQQIAFAFNNDMLCDAAPSNLIYNKEDKSLTFIDFFESNSPFDVKEARPLTKISTASLFGYSENNKYKLKIFTKTLIQATLDDFKYGVTPQLPIDEYDFILFLNNMNKRYSLINTKSSKLYDLLKTSLTELKKLKKQELYSDKDVKNELNGKLKVINCLLNQLYDSPAKT